MISCSAASSTASAPDATPANAANRRWRRALLAILLGGLALKLVRLSEPPDFYLDEVYHAFTAQQYLHGNPAAYDPWAKPPPTRAFEWTHPPLAKLIMAGAMALLGEGAFAWRLGSALSSTAAVGLTALLCAELFGSGAAALWAALLLSLEGLSFTLGRIAMNDAYFICFALFTLLHYVRWKDGGRRRSLLLAATGLGLALATKWTALYLVGIVGIDLLRDLLLGRRRWQDRGLWLAALVFALIPPLLYLASYLHFFAVGRGWRQLLELQQQMWWYHTRLKATHSYQSRPWQWVLNLRPIWLHVAYLRAGWVAHIYSLGNSVTLIAGFAVALRWSLSDFLGVGVPASGGGRLSHAEAQRCARARWARWFVLLAYFALWLPWTLSPRIMLFYHYAPAVPLLCIVLGLAVARARAGEGSLPPWARRAAAVVVLGAALWFVLTYPVLTGLPVPRAVIELGYARLPGWR
ncbi:MAG: phospholipid carrier-dependent glycosyltransferase [Proteobacteria bacterium]|nr:phospholipid carrier-dependent glycosyltransferase [Pseudomonadota bacterium]